MVNTKDLPTPAFIKMKAKQLRAELQANGNTISHSKSLEIISHQYGFKDWNHFSAILQKSPMPLKVPSFVVPNGYHIGDQVRGIYLGQNFQAHIHAVETMGNGYTRLVLDLDEAVDVVTFDSFSAFRKRIRCVIATNGKTPQKTSNGEPQLSLGKL